MSPASRIYELRNQGHLIDLMWDVQIDNAGVKHKLGFYIYRGLNTDDKITPKPANTHKGR